MGSLVLVQAPFAHAEDSNSTSQMETITVTAQALKVETPAQETPKSVAIVGESEIKEKHVQKLDEAFRYTAGFTSPYGPDNDAEWMFVRGLEPSVYLDGNRLYKEGFWAFTSEMYGLEQIELIKGPAGVMYGETYPGGVINLVQKKPTDIPQKSISFSGGSDNYLQLGVDIADWANSDGSQRYRFVAMINQQDEMLDGTENKRIYIAPSYAIDFSDSTTLTLLASFLQDDGVPQNNFKPIDGTLRALPGGEYIDPKTNYGQPNHDKFEKTQITAGYQLDHQINDTWAYKQNFNYTYIDLYLRSTSAYQDWQNNDGDLYSLDRYTLINDGDSNSYTFDNHVAGDWYSQNIEHQLVTGFDYQYHRNKWLGNGTGSFVGKVDSVNPEYGSAPDLTADLFDNDINKKQLGLYSQYQARIAQQWIFNVGARYDDIKVESEGKFKDKLDDNQLSFDTGLMFVADNGLSPYVSYSQSFYVISSLDFTTNKLYDPIESEQKEVGVKYTPDFLDGYINVAWFDIDQENSLITDLDGNGNPTTSQSGTQTNIKGLEIEGKVAVSENTVVTAAYTYMDATSGEGSAKQRKSLIPEHMANTWITYDFTGVGIEGLTAGIGARYTGTTIDATENASVPAYLLWDAMANYKVNKQWDMQLNVTNLTDEEYIAGCDFGICYYGEEARVTATANYKW